MFIFVKKSFFNRINSGKHSWRFVESEWINSEKFILIVFIVATCGCAGFNRKSLFSNHLIFIGFNDRSGVRSFSFRRLNILTLLVELGYQTIEGAIVSSVSIW